MGAREERKVRRKGKRKGVGRVGARGVIVLPADLRRVFGLREGAFVITEERDDGILVRPAAVVALARDETAEEIEDRYDAALAMGRKSEETRPWAEVEREILEAGRRTRSASQRRRSER